MQLFRRFCIQKLVKFHMKTVQTALDLLRYENKKNYLRYCIGEVKFRN